MVLLSGTCQPFPQQPRRCVPAGGVTGPSFSTSSPTLTTPVIFVLAVLWGTRGIQSQPRFELPLRILTAYSEP